MLRGQSDNKIAIERGREVGRDHQAAVRLLCEVDYGPFDIGSIVDFTGYEVEPERVRRGFTLGSFNNVPVRWPPGRARLATKPAPIGSGTPIKTIGIALLSRFNALTVAVPMPTNSSGCSATSSFAITAARSALADA